MRSGFAFPEWLREHSLEDERFARAYDETPASRRALIKTSIARLWEWYGVCRTDSVQTRTAYRAGFISEEQIRPVDYCIVFVDDAVTSPARFLAALTPALAAGVENVLAVNVGSGWTSSFLTSLELVGQEDVVELSQSAAEELLEGLSAQFYGIALCLGSAMPNLTSNHAFCVWHECAAKTLAVGSGYDMDALNFMHPDAETVADPASLQTENVAGAVSSEPIPSISFTIGPGMEACWIHADLLYDMFFRRTIRWILGG